MNFEHPTKFRISTKFNKIKPNKDLTNHFIHILKYKMLIKYIKYKNSVNLVKAY
jgi:hypothetical protein